jgi:hypothetical protein
MKIFSAQLKGTTTVVSGSTASITGSFTGSIAGIDINATNAFTASTIARLNSIETISSSNDSRVNSLEAFSSSIFTTNTFTSSASERLNALETTSASVLTLNSTQNDRLNSLETTSASVDTLNSNQNTRLNNLEDKTGSLATTGSNTFYGTQTFTGSVYIRENLIVQGSSSLQNITASAVDIGTNQIILNVDNPAVRFAGISVYDSGSTQGTGSLWWDSTQNHWLYEHPSDSAAPYNSAILISGPKNSGNLGEETELVSNFVMKAVGGDHISASAIYDDGTTISLKSNTQITGSLSVMGDGGVLNRTTSGEPYLFFRKDGVNRGSIYGISGGGLRIFDQSDNQILTITSSFVGINTSVPGQQLEIRSADGQGIRFKNLGSSDKRWDLVGSGNDFRINETGVGAVISVQAGGNVGVGITNPDAKLQVVGSFGQQIRFGTNSSVYTNISMGTGFTAFDSIGGDSGAYSFRDDGTTRLFIDSNGNVGIGTNVPVDFIDAGLGLAIINTSGRSALSLGSTQGTANEVLGRLSFTNTNSTNIGSKRLAYISGVRGTTNNSAYLEFGTADNALGTQRMVISQTGNVGIGISNPLSKLHIGDTLSNTSDAPNALIIKQTSTNETTGIYLERSGERKGYYIYVGGSLDSLNFQRNNAGTKSDTLTLTRDANVGIGTLTPSSRLGVRATGADGIVLEQDAGASNNSGRLFFLGDVQTYGMFNNAGDIRITYSAQPGNTSGTSFARFTNTGKYFRMESGTGGIQFGGDTAAANALDDYEEGTFTPDIRLGSWAFGARSGFYTKIGNLVTVNLLIVWTSNNVPNTNAFQITLPFSAFGSGNFRAPGSIGYTAGINFNTSRQLVAHVDMSNDFISFQQITSGGAPTGLTTAEVANSGEIQVSITYQV